ncbi:PTS galactitol transporter subunit IIB, partial [Staphylococcus aureus]|nr:PTS galactitol transporter subunit IIB [Staphylococcus aureus]
IIDRYDAVVSTTIVPDVIKAKVTNGLGLLTGIGTDAIYADVKERLGV